MVRRASIFKNGILVVLGMGRGEVSPVKIQIVFLFAMIRQRLARNLPAGDPPAIGERREEDRVDVAALLNRVQDLIDAFIEE